MSNDGKKIGNFQKLTKFGDFLKISNFISFIFCTSNIYCMLNIYRRMADLDTNCFLRVFASPESRVSFRWIVSLYVRRMASTLTRSGVLPWSGPWIDAPPCPRHGLVLRRGAPWTFPGWRGGLGWLVHLCSSTATAISNFIRSVRC